MDRPVTIAEDAAAVVKQVLCFELPEGIAHAEDDFRGNMQGVVPRKYPPDREGGQLPQGGEVGLWICGGVVGEKGALVD